MYEAFANVHRIEPDEALKLEVLAARTFRSEQIRAAFTVGLTTNLGHKYKILMLVPRAYPFRAPVLYTLTHIPGPLKIAHIYGDDGRLCVFEKIGRDWDPKECNLVTAIGWAAMWLFCQEYFQRRSRWPAPESHKTKPVPRSRPWDARKRR
jgi:hypothetical protein